MEPILIRNLDRAAICFLEYAGMHEPTWAHPRAEVCFAFYNLRLLHSPVTRGRFFSGRYATTASGDYIALEEYETDGTTSSFDRVDIRLVIVSTTRCEEAIASQQHHGGVRPVRFESDMIVYEKTRFDEGGRCPSLRALLHRPPVVAHAFHMTSLDDI